MHCCSILAVLFFVSLISTAQDNLGVVSRTLLPQKLRGQFGWGDLRVGCSEDGSTLLALVPPIEKATHEVVKLASSATIKAWIDIEKVPGLDRAQVEDFAPGPNGETYVIARRVASERFKRDQNGRVNWAERRMDKTLWIVRFDVNGHFLAKAPVQVEFTLIRVAVFPSGSLLAVGYLLHEGLVPFAAIISQDGTLVVPVKLPNTVLYDQPEKDGAIVLPVPMLGWDGVVSVVMTGEKPVFATIGADGVVAGIVSLRIPSGCHLGEPRVSGQRIVAEIAPSKFDGIDHFVELDMSSGEVLYLHSIAENSWKLICQMASSSIVTLYLPKSTVDVLAASAKENTVPY